LILNTIFASAAIVKNKVYKIRLCCHLTFLINSALSLILHTVFIPFVLKVWAFLKLVNIVPSPTAMEIVYLVCGDNFVNMNFTSWFNGIGN